MKTNFFKHHLIPYSFSSLPLSVLFRFAETNVVIPYYHMVSDAEVVHIKHLYPYKTVKNFIADLDYIGRNFHPIGLPELLNFTKNNLNLPSKSLCLTFDDGFKEIHDIIAPLLFKKGIPAIFFINSSFTDNLHLGFQHKASVLIEYYSHCNPSPIKQRQIRDLFIQNNLAFSNIKSAILSLKYHERKLIDQIAEITEISFDDYLLKNEPYLDSHQIKKLLRDGFTIGAHSIDHPFYTDLTLEDQINQTLESIKFVREKFDLDYGAFAFPHSDLGVSERYFIAIKETGLVDISFGTAGIIHDCIQNHFQRFSLEKPNISGRKLISMHFIKSLERTLTGTNKIHRPD